MRHGRPAASANTFHDSACPPSHALRRKKNQIARIANPEPAAFLVRTSRRRAPGRPRRRGARRARPSAATCALTTAAARHSAIAVAAQQLERRHPGQQQHRGQTHRQSMPARTRCFQKLFLMSAQSRSYTVRRRDRDWPGRRRRPRSAASIRLLEGRRLIVRAVILAVAATRAPPGINRDRTDTACSVRLPAAETLPALAPPGIP